MAPVPPTPPMFPAHVRLILASPGPTEIVGNAMLGEFLGRDWFHVLPLIDTIPPISESYMVDAADVKRIVFLPCIDTSKIADPTLRTTADLAALRASQGPADFPHDDSDLVDEDPPSWEAQYEGDPGSLCQFGVVRASDGVALQCTEWNGHAGRHVLHSPIEPMAAAPTPTPAFRTMCRYPVGTHPNLRECLLDAGHEGDHFNPGANPSFASNAPTPERAAPSDAEAEDVDIPF